MENGILPWETGEPRSVAAHISAELARDIVEGRREAGDLLTEVGVAEGFSVSRTPVREAFLQLEAWKLVRLLPKKGALVTAVSAAERRDLLDVRSAWEIGAVEGLDAGAPEHAELLTELRDILARQSEALDATDLLRFASLDFSFHMRIIAARGNQVVAELLHHLAPRLARLTYAAAAEGSETIAGFKDDHERLIRFISRGDTDGFADAVRAHIASAFFRVAAR